ncbi:MAG: alpha/beta hydrolase [Bradyrhizobiaceae bacterium]|nr:MAG: alpha/beta hydrolase [Bradyrhizobiaceae bacterium]
MTPRTIALPSGVTLEYVEHGDPHGLPVVCLHGWPDSWRSYETMLPHLPARLRAIAPSHRGFGGSSRLATGYRPADLAADLRAFMDALGILRAVVVGHSMGSIVALRFAVDFPERVAGLGLIGALTGLRDHAVGRELWEQAVRDLADPIDPGFVRDFQESTLALPAPAGFVDTIVAESLKAPARVWRAAFEGMLGEELGGALGGIAAPTFIMWGDQDGLADREIQERLASRIAGAKLVIYRGCGHSPQWERPDRIAADLAAFIAADVAEGVSRRTRSAA